MVFQSLARASLATAALVAAMPAAHAADIAFTTVAKGQYAGLDLALASPRTFQIDDQSSWDEVWTELTSDRQPRPLLPAVDFTAQRVLGIAAEFSSGGHTLEIERIVDTGDQQTVHVKHTKPGSGCFVTMAITQPHHFVSTKRSEKPVSFEVRTVTQACGG